MSIPDNGVRGGGRKEEEIKALFWVGRRRKERRRRRRHGSNVCVCVCVESFLFIILCRKEETRQ